MSGRLCPECQAPLESGALDGICARCLAGLLFDPGPVPEAGLLTEASRARSPMMTSRNVLLELPGYEVTRELARGGMGIVYQATQLEPRREVALKMLLPHPLEETEFRERFLLEARAIARLEHPHILPVYQIGEHAGVPFFTMKLAAGGSLAERRVRYRRSWREIAELVANLSDAVQYAHERGVLHRDLKPGNVLFDDTGRAYVSDFGLAKVADATLAAEEPGQVIGTPRYVAPEVAGQGSELATVSSDIYGLGVILYELLAQKAPFAALSQQALLRMVADAPAAPPSSELRGVPHELDVICMRCLEKDPKRRFQTAGALAQELKHWLLGEPIESLPATGREQFWRWFRQNQVIVGLTLTVVALGLALVVGAIWVAFSQAASRRVVLAERDRARDDLVVARLGEARGLRLSGQFRVRPRALELLSGAAKADESVELRSEAAAVLGRWDVGPEQDRHRHVGVGLPLALSASLDLVADARADGEVRVWRRATGSPLWKLRMGAGRPPSVLEFSPGARWLVAADATRVRVMDGSTGAVLVDQPGRWLGFSADDQVAVLLGGGRQVEYHELPSKRIVKTVPLPADAMGALAVSDGPGLPDFLVQWRDHLEVISAESGDSIQWLPFHRREIQAVSWRDGCILVGDSTGGLRLWNLRSGRMRDLVSHRGPVRRLVVSPDGSLGWSVSDDGETKLWHIRSAQLLGRTEFLEPVRFAKDGVRLVYLDGTEFGIAPMQSPVGVAMVPIGVGGGIRHLEFSPDGKWLIAVGPRGVAVVEPIQGQVVEMIPLAGAVSAHFEPLGHELAVVHRMGIRWFRFGEEGRKVSLSPVGEVAPPSAEWLGGSAGDGDGRTLLIPTESGRLLWYDLLEKKWLAAPADFTSGLDGMVDPERRWVAVGEEGLRLRVQPFRGGATVLSLDSGAGSPVFSPDGRHLLVAGGEVHRVFNTEDWRATLAEPTGTGNTTRGMGRWSRYGRALAVANPRSGVTILSTETWKNVVRLDSMLPVSCLAFGLNGRRLAAGTDDDHVMIWELPELKLAIKPLGLAWTESISPDGVQRLPGPTPGRERSSIDPTHVRLLRRNRLAGPGIVDLAGAMNESLDAAEGVFTGPRERPCDLPVGLVRLDGVEYEFRGYIRVAGEGDGRESGAWVARSGQIRVGRAVETLDMLTAAMGESLELGREVARFSIRWADGVEEKWPIRCGSETGPWLGPLSREGMGSSQAVWTGLSEVGESQKRVNRLYRHRWTNTRPGVVVESIEWLGTQGGGGLRVLALSGR